MDIADFTGRKAELTRLYRQVDDPGTRSVVIIAVEGMAGVGKTRLAVHAAHELVRRGRFEEIQLWADLRGFDPEAGPSDPAAVLASFLELLGVARRQIPADLATRAALYRDRLAGKRALVLLDNAADEAQVRPLLPGTPGCLVLLTSRRTLPDLAGVYSLRLDVFSTAEGVELFSRIAGQRRITAEPAQTQRVVRLCGHLPIAIALAAQRLHGRPMWTVGNLAARLDCGAESGAVVGAFDLSYRSLPPESRLMFRRLGMHPANQFAADSVAALAGVSPAEAEEILETLVDEHLLQEVTPGRYRLHDLLCRYARRRVLAEECEQEREASVRRLLDWYLHAAQTASRVLEPNSGPMAQDLGLVPRHQPDLGNRATALDWIGVEQTSLIDVAAAAERCDPAIAWRLQSVLLSLFYLPKK